MKPTKTPSIRTFTFRSPCVNERLDISKVASASMCAPASDSKLQRRRIARCRSFAASSGTLYIPSDGSRLAGAALRRTGARNERVKDRSIILVPLIPQCKFNIWAWRYGRCVVTLALSCFDASGARLKHASAMNTARQVLGFTDTVNGLTSRSKLQEWSLVRRRSRIRTRTGSHKAQAVSSIGRSHSWSFPQPALRRHLAERGRSVKRRCMAMLMGAGRSRRPLRLLAEESGVSK